MQAGIVAGLTVPVLHLIAKIAFPGGFLRLRFAVRGNRDRNTPEGIAAVRTSAGGLEDDCVLIVERLPDDPVSPFPTEIHIGELDVAGFVARGVDAYYKGPGRWRGWRQQEPYDSGADDRPHNARNKTLCHSRLPKEEAGKLIRRQESVKKYQTPLPPPSCRFTPGWPESRTY